jgi:integrase
VLSMENNERGTGPEQIGEDLRPGLAASPAGNSDPGREESRYVLAISRGQAPDPLALQAAAFARAAKAPSTLRAYAADWRHFVAWCDDRGVSALPTTPETVALYLAALAATHRPATITRRLTAITKAHQARGLVSPATVSELAVGETLKGIRRTLGTAQKAKAPILTADLLRVLAHLPQDLAGIRDRALLLVGYAGAFRRSELAALDLAHLAWVDEGAVLTLGRSKTDQEGQGRKVAIPRGAHAATCPVRALRSWIDLAPISAGPLFRPVDRHGKLRNGRLHPDAVGAIVQRALARAGFDAGKYGGHSLRAGFATQAAKNGATAFDIMRQTGHRSVQTVSRYVREAQLFRDAPASKLGL